MEQALSPEAVEYSDCSSAVGKNTPLHSQWGHLLAVGGNL